MIPQYDIGDVIRLRKKHPCGSFDWKVVRVGVDIGLVCEGCQRKVMLPRSAVNKRLKTILRNKEEKGE